MNGLDFAAKWIQVSSSHEIGFEIIFSRLFIKKYVYLCIHLTLPGLSCGIQDL